jgi:hypothetical protein
MLMGSGCGERQTSKVGCGVAAFMRTLRPQPEASTPPARLQDGSTKSQLFHPLSLVECACEALLNVCFSTMATNEPCLNGYIDNDFDDEADEQPIRLMAEDCDELFHDCLARSGASHEHPLPSEVSHPMKEYHQRFNGWCTFLGVYANEITNLDYRLRNHEALQDMMIRMLNMLRQNLFLGKRFCNSSRERS